MSGSFLGKLFDSILGLLRRKERFFVIELMRSGARATPVVLDAEARVIKVLPVIVPKIGEHLDAFARRLAAPKNAKIIAAIDGGTATTIDRAVALEYAGGVFDEAALEHVIAQAIWKLFDAERAVAAKKMDVSEGDVTIADARVLDIALDGRGVIAPLGYSAKRAEVRLSLTMMPWEAAGLLAGAFPRNVFAINEASVSWARLLWAASPLGRGLLCAGLTGEGVALATASADGVRYHDAFNWGEQTLVSGVASALAVTSDIARYVVRAVRDESRTSPLFAKKVHGIIAAELQLLLNGLQGAVLRTGASAVRVLASYDIPRALFSATLKNNVRRTVKIFPVTPEDIGKHFGFALQWKVNEGRAACAPAIVSFFDAYITPAHVAANAIARRRVRWLIKNEQTNGNRT